MDLYHEIILDHSKTPRNFFSMNDATHSAHGNNPFCGDEVTVMIKSNGSHLVDVSFQGRGCALSMASASIMTETVTNQEINKALEQVEKIKSICTGSIECDTRKFLPFAGVKEFPLRIKCVTMPWHVLKRALTNGRI